MLEKEKKILQDEYERSKREKTDPQYEINAFETPMLPHASNL